MSTGETDLSMLLRKLEPRLHPGIFVFVTVSDPSLLAVAAAIASFREAEGTTLVLPRERAEELGLAYDFEAAWITLRVHSALSAIGLTAAFATALARAGISCNVMAGYYHDHLFVPREQAEPALAALQALARKNNH